MAPRTVNRLLQAFFALVLAAMAWATVTASQDRAVWTAAVEIWRDPWGRATLFDAYFAFLTVYLWIFYRERRWTSRLAWLVAVLLLGNFAIAAYFLLALGRLGDRPWIGLFERPPAPGDRSP